MRSMFRLVVLLACLAPSQAAFAQLTFVQIAREFSGGLWWLDPNFRPAIANDGTVAFAGSHAFNQYTATRIFVGDGGALKAANFSSASLSAPGQLAINDQGRIVFTATRTARIGDYRGVYKLTFKGTLAAFSTLYEGLNVMNPAPGALRPVRYDVAMAPNGTVAFSSIMNGAGALYRSPFAGPYAELRTGTGTFYNTQYLDVNDAGQVVVQMEYGDPTGGLRRGFLVFETPNQTLAMTNTGLERLSIGTQPVPVINASGTIAFVNNGTMTMRFFNPPGVYNTTSYEDVVVGPGVWTVTPGPWSIAKYPTLVAGPANGYGNFGRVDINDSGEIAFEASANGATGVFTGPDPVADKVLASGDVRGNQLYSVVRLGALNNAGDIAIWTSDYYSTDRQVWRVEGAFE
jgi:hypothetical protein